MRTHYTATALPLNASVAQVMMRKTACGAKATQSAALYMSDAWANVDCKRCLAKQEALEATAAAKKAALEARAEAAAAAAVDAYREAEAREAAMANHPAGKARQEPTEDDTDGDPTVITTRDAIATAESWAEATGSLAVIVKIDQVDSDGSTHPQVAGTYRRTPKGAHVGEIISYDRSIKAVFHCKNHPTDVWVSKDPFSSQWFPSGAPHILPCDCPVNAHVLFQDYIYRG